MKRLLIPVVLLGALALPAQTAYAQGASLGLGAGVVQIEDADTSPLWVTGSIRLPVGETFALEPDVGWYRHSEDVWGTEINVDVVNFGGSALFVVPAEQVALWAGAGAGGHMFRVSADGESESETKLGFHFLAGLDFKASESLKLFGGIRYEIIQTEDDLDDSNNLKQWKFYAGLRFGG